ncbi:respiratory nitrate reductase subunit gamma [Nocardia terpenica]|uniref:Nitrate reductase-like protein NarX n=1 Tax=Nocardia terpenica TaxID=455432 RepID=A0A6G9Z3Z3_9NOCA|nr:respiratory nitrate reductase subunit gamma [Nocardia terpenica]QIS20202.1 respiratory nitrate reductase subunit gamma [Nocardia terpenica]
MSAAQLWWWVILPYLALTTFLVGHIWRWRHDQFGWTSRSSQLQEGKLLRWGGPMFHYATFAAIGGHVVGILIPESFTRALGIPEPLYRWFSAGAGTVAVLGILGGVGILAYRRLTVARIRAATSPLDWVAFTLLGIIIVLGVIPTVAVNLLGAGYDYRESVALWFRGLLTGDPDVAAIAHAPLLYQVHATAAWAILALWPFTRLVHAWSYPLWYLWRPYIIYRRRPSTRPAEPGTGGRRWQRIGTRN